MKIKDIIILVLAAVVLILFFFRKKEVVVVDDSDAIAHLELRHIWDSTSFAGYKMRSQLIIDSVEYYKGLANERGDRITYLEKKHYKKQQEIDTSSVELLSIYFDSYAGERKNKAVKILDSSQVVKSVKLFTELDHVRDVVDELTDENNYLTIVSVKYEEAYDNCQEEVIALNDTLSNRKVENEQYVVDSTEECNKEIKKVKKKLFWQKVVILGVTVGLVFVLLK